MAITTYATFLSGLGDISVTGVNRALDHPPASLNTADCPVMWVDVPEGEEGPLTHSGEGGWPTLRGEIVIAIEAVGQATQVENWDALVAMFDYLSTALRGVTRGTLCQSHLTWDISKQIRPVAGTEFWAVVATVEGNG